MQIIAASKELTISDYHEQYEWSTYSIKIHKNRNFTYSIISNW